MPRVAYVSSHPHGCDVCCSISLCLHWVGLVHPILDSLRWKRRNALYAYRALLEHRRYAGALCLHSLGILWRVVCSVACVCVRGGEGDCGFCLGVIGASVSLCLVASILRTKQRPRSNPCTVAMLLVRNALSWKYYDRPNGNSAGTKLPCVKWLVGRAPRVPQQLALRRAVFLELCVYSRGCLSGSWGSWGSWCPNLLFLGALRRTRTSTSTSSPASPAGTPLPPSIGRRGGGSCPPHSKR